MGVHKHFAILILIIPCIFANCIIYTFEHNYYAVFTNSLGICVGMNFWELGNYSSLSIETPHPRSEKCIKPLEQLSCVSSFIFVMQAGGVVEAIVYMDTTSNTDQIAVFGHQLVSGGNDAVVGVVSTSVLDPNFTNDWSTLRMTLVGSGTYNGYVTIMGSSSRDSMVLVDSFRYIPPGVNEDSCPMYKADNQVQSTTPTATDQYMPCTNAPVSPPLDVVCDCMLLEITILTLVAFIVLTFVGSCCYCVGKRRGKRIQRRANNPGS